MDSLEDLTISLLNFKFFMIHIIHKIFLLIKNHLNYLIDNIFKCFFKKYNRYYFNRSIIFVIKKVFFHNIS